MTDVNSQQALFEYLLRLGDTALINGQRLSEWCGHGPFLEEDIGVANTALDLVGRARMLLSYAGEIEGKGRGEDDLAFLRDERDWRNLLIAELPKGDFAFTTARQFLLDAFAYPLYDALQSSADERLAAIAAKAVKESAYHLRHTGEWMLRLGDGTDQSRRRIQAAIEEVWPFKEEMFAADAIDETLREQGVAPSLEGIRKHWNAHVDRILEQATLTRPADGWPKDGGRRGQHTEHMGFLLAEMQFMQRAYPGLQW
jgi:ring-1,2-phenylacetyl-CoA epoxidase subunit PaaC